MSNMDADTIAFENSLPLISPDILSMLKRVEQSLDFYERKYGFLDSDELGARKYLANSIRLLGDFKTGNAMMKKYLDCTMGVKNEQR